MRDIVEELRAELRKDNEYIRKINNENDQSRNKIGDLQRLCERAFIILSENWKNYTEDGYGPSSLLRDLEKAKNGEEYKELRAFSNMVIKRFSENEKYTKNLEQQLEKCKEVLRPFTQDDLCKVTGGMIQNDNSLVWGKDKALLRLGDFKKARTLLKELEDGKI